MTHICYKFKQGKCGFKDCPGGHNVPHIPRSVADYSTGVHQSIMCIEWGTCEQNPPVRTRCVKVTTRQITDVERDKGRSSDYYEKSPRDQWDEDKCL